MKKLIAVFLTIVFAFGLVGCGAKEGEEAHVFPLDDRFYIVVDTNDSHGVSYLIVDRETRVQYLFIDSGYQGGMSVVLGADGKPLLYEGELE